MITSGICLGTCCVLLDTTGDAARTCGTRIRLDRRGAAAIWRPAPLSGSTIVEQHAPALDGRKPRGFQASRQYGTIHGTSCGDMSARIYLDYNASAPLKPPVRAAMAATLDACGNPSSVHGFGRAARRVVEGARESVAGLVGAAPASVVFTSGRTEANAVALHETGRGPAHLSRARPDTPPNSPA